MAASAEHGVRRIARGGVQVCTKNRNRTEAGHFVSVGLSSHKKGMTMEVWMLLTIGFLAGGAFIWFGKTLIQRLVIDANTLSAKLHAQADAIAASVKKV